MFADGSADAIQAMYTGSLQSNGHSAIGPWQ